MSLNDKIESALVAYIQTIFAEPGKVFPGKSWADPTLPCVLCTADGDGMEDPIGSGNAWFNGSVTLRHSACDSADGATAKDEQQAMSDSLFNAVRVEDLAAQLTASVPGLTVFAVQFSAPESGEDQAGVWIEVLPVRIYACASELTA